MSILEENSIPNQDDNILHQTLELLEWPLLCKHLASFASTERGMRCCRELFLPNELESSKELLNQTIEIGSLDNSLEGGLNFDGIHDLHKIIQRCAKGGIANGEELLLIAKTLSCSRKIKRQIYDPEIRPYTTLLVNDVQTISKLEKTLYFCLEDGGRIADRASSKLADLRRNYFSMRIERTNKLQTIIRKYSYVLQDSSISDRNGRAVISLKPGASDLIPGIIHSTSSSGNTLFLEPNELINLGNRIAECYMAILREENNLLSIWSNSVSDNASALILIVNVMTKLDISLAKARYGKWIKGVVPVLEEAGDASFILRNFRHPLLIWEELKNNGNHVVPVSIEVLSKIKVVAITGPNTGGKTVTLKSVGLAALMAKAGMLLPCSENPSLPWCKKILADIGDEQSLQQNLSTFSGHILRIRSIFDALKTKGTCLVLLDEVGAGTDPIEGTALAISILKSLASRARLTIATTHFGQLKTLKYSDERFENASVTFDCETMSPTYSLQWGIPGRSNALEIAKRLGFDNGIIEDANKVISSVGADNIDSLIKSIEEQRERQQFASEEAAALLIKTEVLHNEILSHFEKQSLQSAKAKEIAQEEINKTIIDGQKEVKSLIKRLRNKSADGETARKIGQRLKLLERQNKLPLTTYSNNNWLPEVGDQVRLISLGRTGEVLNVSSKDSELIVQYGLFRIKVDFDDIESIDGKKVINNETVIQFKKSSYNNKISNIRNSQNTIDVRGLRVHEAESVVDEYLRKNISPLWVIHGIGTGRLKQGLRSWLKTVSNVERFFDADSSEGGDGCTVIWLK